MGKQELTTDTVERYIEASPEVLYDFIADVTRTPERTPDITRCEWLDGATGPAVGARFKAINSAGKVGSSRVDLQACKLEYSIVSPK